jgi:hypothetical protein
LRGGPIDDCNPTLGLEFQKELQRQIAGFEAAHRVIPDLRDRLTVTGKVASREPQLSVKAGFGTI